ncbi:MAG: division/cell wall cluster transcriptional repressor MraZ [Clostridiales bacterium]
MGEFHHTIDKKGRMSIPAKFREGLGENFVLTKGANGCVCAYSMEEWEKMEEKITNSEFFSKTSNLPFMRALFSSASDAETDAMGRVLVAPSLREYADLNDRKDVTIIGVVKRVEIWATDRWEAYCSENEESVDIGAGMERFEI